MSGFETYGLLFPNNDALDSMTVIFKLTEVDVFCVKWTELLVVDWRDSNVVCGTRRFDPPFASPAVLIRKFENIFTTF